VREVLLIGAAADRIAQELSGAVELIRAGNLETAVPEAFQHACPGDVVLLAPACSSFDQFQDYEHRGRVFKELVERLAQDVESGAFKWKWNSREETASQGLEAVRQVQAQSLAGSPHAAHQASSEPAPPQVSSQPGAEPSAPEGEEALQQVAEPADEESKRRAATAPPAEATPHELTLVYEVTADEFPPAEVELAEDNSERPETAQPQARATSEKVDGAPLPYERRAKETQLKLPQMD
jgi:UDP-N-acetylmuramoylalanine--D-glutamate ligase